MLKMDAPYSLQLISMFSAYTHSIPVIYSVLEGQYAGDLFVDSKDNPQIAILFTPFDFHFVAGNAQINKCVDVIDKAIFEHYLPETGKKEAIVFCPDPLWDKVLDEVFKRHNGIKDNRRVFRLNKEHFINHVYGSGKTLEGVENKLFYEQERGAEKQYPTCRVFKDEECVSFCSGFMLGKGHAEIDVFTLIEHRRKGYAKEASVTLINELLNSGIEPDWCTWPYRTESEKLALSLGYKLWKDIPAHIWVEAECGVL